MELYEKMLITQIKQELRRSGNNFNSCYWFNYLTELNFEGKIPCQ